jgi:hypothetical protein
MLVHALIASRVECCVTLLIDPTKTVADKLRRLNER